MQPHKKTNSLDYLRGDKVIQKNKKRTSGHKLSIEETFVKEEEE